MIHTRTMPMKKKIYEENIKSTQQRDNVNNEHTVAISFSVSFPFYFNFNFFFSIRLNFTNCRTVLCLILTFILLHSSYKFVGFSVDLLVYFSIFIVLFILMDFTTKYCHKQHTSTQSVA